MFNPVRNEFVVKSTEGRLAYYSLDEMKLIKKFRFSFKGNYTGSRYVTFKINPKGTSISSIAKLKKGFTVKWKKQSGKMATSRITGYQYRYSTSSKMTSPKTVTVKGYSKTSAKKTGLPIRV